MLLKKLPGAVSPRSIKCVVFIFICLMQALFPAAANVNTVIHTGEGMKEHTSDEPRRLMHDIMVEELNKGKVLRIVNPQNSAQPQKHHLVPYHVGANLIAFQASEKMPVRVSISMQLVRYSTGNVIMASDKAIDLSPSTIAQGLKMHNREFDNSVYGKALAQLTREATKKFEDRCIEMKLE